MSLFPWLLISLRAKATARATERSTFWPINTLNPSATLPWLAPFSCPGLLAVLPISGVFLPRCFLCWDGAFPSVTSLTFCRPSQESPSPRGLSLPCCLKVSAHSTAPRTSRPGFLLFIAFTVCNHFIYLMSFRKSNFVISCH